jgi:hypothetical protein
MGRSSFEPSTRTSSFSARIRGGPANPLGGRTVDWGPLLSSKTVRVLVPFAAPIIDWYWIDAYPHVVDMLRNEKPVFFTFVDTIAAAILKTGWEPPGELEPPQPP